MRACIALAAFALAGCPDPEEQPVEEVVDDGCPTRLRVDDMTARFDYDDDGRVVRYVEDTGGVIQYTADRAFDDDGRLIRQIDRTALAVSTMLFAYDAAGEMSEIVQIGPSGRTSTRYFRDALGRFAGYASDRDGDGEIDDAVTYRWDGAPTTFGAGSNWWFTVIDDIWLTRVVIDDSELIETFEYDPFVPHRLVRRDLFGSDGSSSFIAFRYDDAGRAAGYEADDRTLDVARDTDGRVIAKHFEGSDGVVRDDALTWDDDGFVGMTRRERGVTRIQQWIVERGCVNGSVAVRRSPFRAWHDEPYDPADLVDVTGWARSWDPLMAE